jgi:hypothetical protein
MYGCNLNFLQAALRYFSDHADDRNWKWLVLVEDDTSLSVAKIAQVIQVPISDNKEKIYPHKHVVNAAMAA